MLGLSKVIAPLGLALVVSLAGCKQGEGETCQVSDDCESGLSCNQLTKRCQRGAGDSEGGIDITPDAGGDGGRIDAPVAPIDAPVTPIDAPVTPIDAPVTPIDASLPDAS